jgi:hypothetical protein
MDEMRDRGHAGGVTVVARARGEAAPYRRFSVMATPRAMVLAQIRD